MNYKKLVNRLSLLMLGTLLISACGGGATSSESTTSGETATEVETTSEAPETTASTGEVVEINISGNDQMQYDTDMIEVPAGSTVRLTMTHSGQLAKEAMGHNWVLLKQGTSLEDFAMTAIQSAGTDYIPASEEANIIAHTKMLGGGESDTIEFQAPAAGEYEFLCSFPGHYGMMRGTFVVK